MSKVAKLVQYSRVQEARDELIRRSLEAVQLYYDNIKAAALKGDHETVMKSLQWILERTPRDPESGIGIIDVSVDKIPSKEVSAGQTINIGFKLGGLEKESQTKAIEGKIVKDSDDH